MAEPEFEQEWQTAEWQTPDPLTVEGGANVGSHYNASTVVVALLVVIASTALWARRVAAARRTMRRTRLGLPVTATKEECTAKEGIGGELAAWCGGWRGWVQPVQWRVWQPVPSVAAPELAAAVRRLALAAVLQDRLAEDSPAAEDGVKLLDVLLEVAAAATLRAEVRSSLACNAAAQPAAAATSAASAAAQQLSRA